MELLVVTLVYTTPDRDASLAARMRLIAETIRNTQGLVTSHFYRGRGNEPYYLMLTTWEDEDSWHQAQERSSPKQLLHGSELLVAPPEQWLLHYLWGYSRPAVTPILIAAQMATSRPDQADTMQRAWTEGLRRQATESTLAFAFLARGTPEMSHAMKVSDSPSTFINLLSWASETEREEFYATSNYRALNGFLNSMALVQILPLEPL